MDLLIRLREWGRRGGDGVSDPDPAAINFSPSCKQTRSRGLGTQAFMSSLEICPRSSAGKIPKEQM
jgi:hypothetical protein